MGIEDTMGLLGSHRTPAQGPAGTGAYKKTIKKGYAGYGDIITPKTTTPDFFGGKPADPYYQPKTEAETQSFRNKSGIAPTANNMGSLAVKFREEEEATRQAGGITETGKREAKINTIRMEDRTKLWTDAARAKTLFNKRSRQSRKDWTGGNRSGFDPKNRTTTRTNNKAYGGPNINPLGGPTAPGGTSFGLFK